MVHEWSPKLYVLVFAVVVHEWPLKLYGTNGENPNEHLVRANKTTRVVEKEPDQACDLPVDSLRQVMHHEKQVHTRVIF